MDSMRSLNTSLPKTRRQPDVHQSFRTAALNVTNLYKSALADLERARNDGYQEALEDLLSFLEKENMGLGDGEDGRIRQWIAERMDGWAPKVSNSDSDDEYLEEKRMRSSSPVMERNHGLEEAHRPRTVTEPGQRSESAPPPIAMEVSTTGADSSPLQPVFHFAVAPSFPISLAGESTAAELSTAARRSFPPPRRSSTRPSSRSLQRSAAQNLLQLGSGAGQKRKLMQDFFNIDGFNDQPDDSPGGPKRGRMS